MTSDEIKQNTSMSQIIARYGFQTNRIGFISCPFHQGDRTASMKIYKDSYHCFGCGASGDIFTFVQQMEGIDFKEAFKMLGGAYKSDFSSYFRLEKIKRDIKRREQEDNKMIEEIRRNAKKIGKYRILIDLAGPLSQTWIESYNKLQYCIYYHEVLAERRAVSGLK